MPQPFSTSLSGSADYPAADALSVAKLSTAPDSELVRLLLSTVRTLRGATVSSIAAIITAAASESSSPSSSASSASASKAPRAKKNSGQKAARASSQMESVSPASPTSPALTAAIITAVMGHLRSLADTLLTDTRLARSTQLDVSQLVACALCDIIRLHTEASSTSPLRYANDTNANSTLGSKQHPDGTDRHQPHQLNADKEVAQPLPFPLSSTLTALRVIGHPFQLLCEAGEASPATAILHRCSYIIERAAATRALRHLLPFCLAFAGGAAGAVSKADGEVASATESLLQSFFASVAFAGGATHGAFGGIDSKSNTDGAGMMSLEGGRAAMTTEMVRILGDILEATNTATVAQLQPLLSQVLAASPSLRIARTGSSPSKVNHSSDSHTSNDTVPMSIAARLFLNQVDIIQPAIASVAVGHLERGTEKLAAAFFHVSAAGTTAAAIHAGGHGGSGHGSSNSSGNTDLARQELERRRQSALREIAHALEIFTAMMELNVRLCAQLMPLLLPYLSHELLDVRLLLYRGFMAAWGSSREALPAYQSAFLGALSRFQDSKPIVRVEAAASASTLMRTLVRKQWPFPLVLATWQAFRVPLTQRLTDVHVAVRLQAVQSYAEILEVAPGVAVAAAISSAASRQGRAGSSSREVSRSQPLTGYGNESAESWERAGVAGHTRTAAEAAAHDELAATLGRRTADRNARVRERAVQCLCRLYRSQPRFSWVPDCVLNATNAEGGARLVELELESMLPMPTRAASPGVKITVGGGGVGGHAAASTSAVALFDFEKEAETEQPGQSYVRGWVRLCGDLHAAQFARLLALVRTKPSLRRAIARLFELRAEVKVMPDPRCPQGEAALHSVRRLLTFLQSATYAEKGEWDAIFRARDDRVSRAMLAACAAPPSSSSPTASTTAVAGSLAGLAEREDLLSSLKGRLEPEVYRFVSDSLVRQMMLPLDVMHVQVLLEQLDEYFRLSRLTARRPSALDGADSNTGSSGREDSTAQALLRTLLIFASASPPVLLRSLETLLRALEVVTQAAIMVQAFPVCSPDTLLLLLQAISEWASVAKTTAAAVVPPAKQRASDAVSTLRDLCLAGRAARNLALSFSSSTATATTAATAATAGHVRTEALTSISRAATRTLLALVSVPGFLCATTAQAGLVESVRASLIAHATTLAAAREKASRATGDDGGHPDANAHAATTGAAAAAKRRSAAADVPRTVVSDETSEDAATIALRAVAWLSTVRTLADDSNAAMSLHSSSETNDEGDDALTQSVTNIFYYAVADSEDKSESARLPRRSHSHHSNINNKGNSSSSAAARLAQMLECVSVASATTDAAAKALTSIALSATVDRRSRAISSALDALLQGYRMAVCRPAGASTVGSSQRRLAIDRQLARLLVQPSAAIGKELAVAVIFSSEEEEPVLLGIQRALATNLVADGAGLVGGPVTAAVLAPGHASMGGDVRYAAFLLLTAMACTGRGTYNELKNCVQAVAARMRGRQAALRATLADPAALQCYLEYTIPFLILFMAHHSFYAEESTAYRFINYQRVWHLLFDELFRHSTQCAGFVAELLARIKAADDIVDPASDKHRVLCDLGSRVMLACLGQRQTSLDALGRHPGSVLLPNFFVRSSRADAQRVLETVYLDASITVTATAAFRVRAGADGGAVGGGGGDGDHSTSHGSSRSSSSTSRSRCSSSEVNLEATPRVVNTHRGRPLTAVADTPTTGVHRLQSTDSGNNTLEDEEDNEFHNDGRRSHPHHHHRQEGGEGAMHEPSASAARDSRGSASRRSAGGRRRQRSVSPPVATSRGSLAHPATCARSGTAAADPAAATDTASLAVTDTGRGRGRRTEAGSKPTSMPQDGSDTVTATSSIEDGVDSVLNALLKGLRRPEIAQLRWKTVKSRIESVVLMNHAGSDRAAREAALDYARERLRVRYEEADR